MDPAEPDYLRNLAELVREQGDHRGAVTWMRQAAEVTLRAPTVERLNLLAAGWLDLGLRLEAFGVAVAALRMQDNTASRQLFAEALRGIPSVSSADRPFVACALSEAWGPIDTLQRPVTAILRDAWPESIGEAAQDELLVSLLEAGPINDLTLEQRLTVLRRDLLLEPASEDLWDFQGSLATQCFINEYAWLVSNDEAAAVDCLIAGDLTPENLLRIATYMPLGAMPNSSELLHGNWPEPVRKVLRQQVIEPAQERAIGASTESLTSIRGGVSQLVRAMYEENPYPRWTKVRAQEPQPLERVLRTAFPRVSIAPLSGAAAPEILVAGCGTGQHAIHVATRYCGAKVLAVDLSRASLGYAGRKAKELGIENIEFAHADFLELRGLEFDVVESAGVLPCLADPFEGARALAELLRPGGVLRLGLYSATARTPLAAAQALGKEYPSSANGIREFRRQIMEAPEGDPLRDALEFGDFYSASNCRDLLLHVQEHVHHIYDLRRMTEDNGLRILGFVVRPEIATRYRQWFPDDPAATNWDYWAVFERENPDIFRGMYQFWLQKSNGSPR